MSENTVTISLAKYEEMQKELADLREKVKQKEVIRYEQHWLYLPLMILVLFAIVTILYKFAPTF